MILLKENDKVYQVVVTPEQVYLAINESILMHNMFLSLLCWWWGLGQKDRVEIDMRLSPPIILHNYLLKEVNCGANEVPEGFPGSPGT